MTIDQLNSLSREAFLDAVGWVFEHSPWVAERTWAHRPFPSVSALHQRMADQVAAAAKQEQLALLNAHPDLGTRAKVSGASEAEQAGAGLDRLTTEEFERLGRLNTLYRGKFGFPFLYAVKGSTKHDILRALELRVKEPAESEFQEALRQVYRIAGFRLEDSVEDPGVRC
jgi:2-oxo-4-hydroxy-4-carboxy-5-ureidoimidazoline decarboxylase